MEQRKFEDRVKFTRGHFKWTVERYKTYYGMFRGKIKGGERKETRWIGKEQVSKNRGKRGHKGPAARKAIAGQYFDPIPTPDHSNITAKLSS